MTKRRVKPNRRQSRDEEQSNLSIPIEKRSLASVQRVYRLYSRHARRGGSIKVASLGEAQLNHVQSIYTTNNDIQSIKESNIRSEPFPDGIESISPFQMASATSSRVSTHSPLIFQSLPA